MFLLTYLHKNTSTPLKSLNLPGYKNHHCAFVKLNYIKEQVTKLEMGFSQCTLIASKYCDRLEIDGTNFDMWTKSSPLTQKYCVSAD